MGSTSPASAAERSEISLNQLREMFADMRTRPGYAKWNVDGELLWGYFFTDPEPKKLRPVAEQLSQRGYQVVSIHQAEDKSTFFLHVERIEHHTPESLHQRNQEFYKLARQFGLQSYDGMDVGPVAR
ncbi:ribonuclease E inhibitor RraB [Rubrivivax albus]|uniref:Ribonuclease E inhibitor RraB n=2 Tax=Rubrivivax albus TaxID=2499835 RepID=A0A437JKA7_9BURK|nr:ribonuclease E inhibitor RraB [Rubrivivax albus]